MMFSFVGSIVCTAALLLAQPDAAPQSSEIVRAIAQLGADDFAARQQATDFLWRAGVAAESELRSALKSTDPEVRTRAAAVLDRLRMGIRPDTPLDVQVLIDVFLHGGSSAARRQALAELQTKADWRTILNLIRGETDPDEQQALAAIVTGEIGKVLRPLLVQGKFDETQELLELLATSDQGLSQLAAFWLLTGRLDAQIEQTRARLAAAVNDDDARRLTQLLRTKGDFSAAAAAAPSNVDALHRAKLFAAAHRWKEAAAAAADLHSRDSSRYEAAALAATYHRLSGNDAGYQSIIDKLTKAAGPDADQAKPPGEGDPFAPSSSQPNGLAWTLCETLLINEQPEPALASLRSVNPQFAHTILSRQHRHAEALALVNVEAGQPLDRAWLDKLPTMPNVARIERMQRSARFTLAAQVARQLRELGRAEQAGEILGTLRAAAAIDNDQGAGWLAVVSLDWQLARFEDLGRDAAAALSSGAKPPALFGAILRQQSALAAFWFAYLLERTPQLGQAQAFEHSLWLVVAQPPRGRLQKDWREIVTGAHGKVKAMPPPQRNQALALLAQTCLIRGDRELARRYYEEAATSDLSVAIKLGDLDATSEDWAAAAKWYEKAAAGAMSDSLAIYLHGYAQAKSGQAEAGAKRIKLASLLALSPDARLALATGLQERGLKDEAAEQFEIASRTASADSPLAANAAQQVGNLVSEKEPLRAADCWQQILLQVLSPTTNFTEDLGYLTLPHTKHKVRARAFLTSGQAEAAARELEQAERTLPGDLRLIVEFVPKLERAGQAAAAEKIFTQAFAVHQRVCEAFPTSATYHNNAAWLAARSQRQLDAALALAAKAVELSPGESAYHDTLAEVHFQRGDREAAVAAAQIAVELSGESKLARARLLHFETGELKSLDGTEAEAN